MWAVVDASVISIGNLIEAPRPPRPTKPTESSDAVDDTFVPIDVRLVIGAGGRGP